jgi:hypothetical protein
VHIVCVYLHAVCLTQVGCVYFADLLSVVQVGCVCVVQVG